MPPAPKWQPSFAAAQRSTRHRHHQPSRFRSTIGNGCQSNPRLTCVRLSLLHISIPEQISLSHAAERRSTSDNYGLPNSDRPTCEDHSVPAHLAIITDLGAFLQNVAAVTSDLWPSMSSLLAAPRQLTGRTPTTGIHDASSRNPIQQENVAVCNRI